MECNSDWFDNLFEPANFETKTRSEVEIREWVTEENLSEVRKALYILAKGFPSQKLVILKRTDSLFTEYLGEKVVQIMLVRVT